MKKATILFLLVLIIILNHAPAHPYSEDTHAEINRHITQNAVAGFSLNSYLMNTLGFNKGIYEEFNKGGENNTVQGWLGIGGRKEDKPAEEWRQKIDYVCNGARNHNHFHNPIYSRGVWGEAGLNEGVSA